MVLFTVACKNEEKKEKKRKWQHWLSMTAASLYSCCHGPLCLAKSITSSLKIKFVPTVFKIQKEEWKVSSNIKHYRLFKFAIQILNSA